MTNSTRDTANDEAIQATGTDTGTGARPDVHYCALADDVLVHLRGREVPAFLQGQLTCDTRPLGPGRSALGALCNVRGRVESDLRLLVFSSEHCALRVDQSLAAHVEGVLRRYAMFSRISVSVEAAAWQLAACWGEQAASLVDTVCGERPQGQDGCIDSGGVMLCQTDAGGAAFELYADTNHPASARVLERLSAQAEAALPCQWRQAELRRGLIRLREGDQDQHVPQVLNYDLAGLISFRKGCYTGQEVVARLHYRGKAKRRAALYELPAGAATPAAGSPVFDEAGAATVGTVLHVLPCAAQSTLLCAIVNTEVAHHSLRAGEAAGSTLLPLQPPPRPSSAEAPA